MPPILIAICFDWLIVRLEGSVETFRGGFSKVCLESQRILSLLKPEELQALCAGVPGIL